jgi:hypothetical protein
MVLDAEWVYKTDASLQNKMQARLTQRNTKLQEKIFQYSGVDYI